VLEHATTELTCKLIPLQKDGIFIYINNVMDRETQVAWKCLLAPTIGWFSDKTKQFLEWSSGTMS